MHGPATVIDLLEHHFTPTALSISTLHWVRVAGTLVNESIVLWISYNLAYVCMHNVQLCKPMDCDKPFPNSRIFFLKSHVCPDFWINMSQMVYGKYYTKDIHYSYEIWPALIFHLAIICIELLGIKSDDLSSMSDKNGKYPTIFFCFQSHDLFFY